MRRGYSDGVRNRAWAVEHVWPTGSFRCQYFQWQFTFFLIVSFHMIDSTYEKQKLQCILNGQGECKRECPKNFY